MVRRFLAAPPLALILAIGLLFGIGHFLLVVPPRFVLADYPKWADPGGDESQMLIGVIALLRDRWHFPLPATDLLSFGGPVSIVFTDSNPWLTVLLKALGAPARQVSVPGFTALLDFALQPAAFALFLWVAGVRRIEALLLGALLGATLPAWYLRVAGHLALASHWLIALALALAAQAIRRGMRAGQVVAACLLGALALGIHAYLFLMVTALLLAAFLADVFRPVRGAVPRALAAIGAYLAVQGAAALTLGYWTGGGSSRGFGLYSMNLLSPFVPQRSGLRALLTGNQGAIIDANGGMQWEGFNYFGTGLFLLFLVAVLVLLLRRAPGPSAPVLRAAIPLGLALLALTCLALSDRVYAGRHLLLSLRPPGFLMPALDQARSSGRLFWAVSYALIGAAVAVLARVRARRRPAVALVLLAALALQIVETRELRAAVHASAIAGPEAPLFAPEPWTLPPLAGSAVRILPNFNCAEGEDAEPIRQLTLLVLRAGGRLEGGPSARMPKGECERTAQQAIDLPGGPDVVNVLFRRSLPAETMRRAAASGRCVAFRSGLACGPRALQSALPRADANDSSRARP